MKSFMMQPFDKRVYITQCPVEFANRYSLYDTEVMLPEELNACQGMAGHVVRNKAPNALFIIYLAQGTPPSVLWHESLHMTHFLMDYCGMPIDMESTELQAYTMECIAMMAAKRLQ